MFNLASVHMAVQCVVWRRFWCTIGSALGSRIASRLYLSEPRLNKYHCTNELMPLLPVGIRYKFGITLGCTILKWTLIPNTTLQPPQFYLLHIYPPSWPVFKIYGVHKQMSYPLTNRSREAGVVLWSGDFEWSPEWYDTNGKFWGWSKLQLLCFSVSSYYFKPEHCR